MARNKNWQKKEQKSKSRIKYLVIIVLLILIAGGIYYFVSNSQQGIIGNKRILDEISRLLTISGQRQLTPYDFYNLEKMVAGDSIAEDYVADGKQFAQYGVTAHIGHSLGGLYTYLQTGKDQVCIPHEVEHLGTFVQVNDFSRTQEILKRYNESFNDWYQNSFEQKKKFPVLYENLDKLVLVLNRTVENYRAGNYQAVLDDLLFITQNDYLGCNIPTSS